MKQFIVVIVLSVIMMGAGVFLHPSFFELSVDWLTVPGNTKLSATDIVTETPWIFAVGVGSLPLLYFALMKLAPIKSYGQGVFSMVLMLLGGLSVWYIRIKYISDELTDQSLSNGLRGFDANYLPADQLKFSLFFSLGILVGAIFAFVVLSFIASPREKKRVDF